MGDKVFNVLLVIGFVIFIAYQVNKNFGSNKAKQTTTLNTNEKEPTQLDFTPKVSQKLVDMAIERIKSKNRCSKKYRIVSHSTSVTGAYRDEYNVFISVIDPCNNMAKKFMIQYKQYENENYGCTKEVLLDE